MNAFSCDVAVVGAGPTGLTLANLLGRVGVKTVLIERNSSTVAEPRAVSIDDESLRTIQAAGLVDAVLKDVALDYGSHYFTRGGACFLKVEPTTREYGYPRRNAFTQPKLEATLREGLARFPQVAPLFGHVFEGAVEDDSGVTIKMREPGGEEAVVHAAYLVGADGARSEIRKLIGATLTGSTYQQKWLIVDLARTAENLRQTRVVCNPARPLITLPGPDGVRRYEFMLMPGEDAEAMVQEDKVRALLGAHGPDGDAPIVRRQVYAFHARIADRWQTRRIFLAGDAAHLTPPFAGQGMNSGLRDAQNLAWKLGAVVQRRLGPGVLQTYQAERAPHAWSLIQLAVNMGRVMMPTSPLRAALVAGAFRAMRVLPRLQSYFALMKYKPRPFYRDGLIARADGGLGLAGRMLPQPRVERADRSTVLLDELMADGFALLAYGPQAEALAHVAPLNFPVTRIAILPQIQNAAGAADSVLVVRDLANALAPLARDRQTILLLVRPDRYIAVAALLEQEAAFITQVHDLLAATWSKVETPLADAAAVPA
jgi:3-(3-hydroxy-phenyl)propionate hydroxylase